MKLFLYLFLIYSLSFSQDNDSKVIEHFNLFSELLVFDATNLAKKEYNIAIILNPKEDNSKENADDLVKLLKPECEKLHKINNISYNIVLMEFKDKSSLFITSDNKKINLYYISQELEEEDIERILLVSQKLGIISFTAVNDFYDLGVSSTVKLVNNSPVLLIKQSQIIKERPNFKFDLATFSLLQR
jgi:hypothetical protein